MNSFIQTFTCYLVPVTLFFCFLSHYIKGYFDSTCHSKRAHTFFIIITLVLLCVEITHLNFFETSFNFEIIRRVMFSLILFSSCVLNTFFRSSFTKIYTLKPIVVSLNYLTLFGQYLMVYSHGFSLFILGLVINIISLSLLAVYLSTHKIHWEGNVKFLIFMMLALALLLCGLSFISDPMSLASEVSSLSPIIVLLSLSLLLGLFPLHFWCPDVNEGLPTYVSGLIILPFKFSILIQFIYLLNAMYESGHTHLLILMSKISLVSIILPALLICVQVSVKRIVSYLSISYTGMLVLLFLAYLLSQDKTSSHFFILLLFYCLNILVIHGFLNFLEIKNRQNLLVSDVLEFIQLRKIHKFIIFIPLLSCLLLPIYWVYSLNFIKNIEVGDFVVFDYIDVFKYLFNSILIIFIISYLMWHPIIKPSKRWPRQSVPFYFRALLAVLMAVNVFIILINLKDVLTF